MTTCAQPYGINTAGAVGKTFGVLKPAFDAAVAARGGTVARFTGVVSGLTDSLHEDAMYEAWSVACGANLFGGLFEFIGAFIAPAVIKAVPEGAFLVPIAGVGLTYLGYDSFVKIFGSETAEFPLVGFVPFLLIFLSFFGANNLFGRVPSMIPASIVGIIIFAIVNPSAYGNGYENAWKGAGIAVPDIGKGFSQLSSHAGLVTAYAASNAISTFACNIAARLNGDDYSPSESMVVDGVGSMLGALFGSPYGTTVYIGHTTYKQFGATRGYSVLNGLVYFIFGLSGLHAIANAIIPKEIILGVLVCVGFMMAAQAVESVPKRWLPAMMLGLSLTFSDYMKTYPRTAGGNTILIAYGYTFLAFLFTFLLMMLIDRWFLSCGVILLTMSFLTTAGFIHSTQLGFDFTSSGTHSHDVGTDLEGTTPAWKIIVTYAVSGLLMLALYVFQKVGMAPPAEEDDFRVTQAAKYARSKSRCQVTSLIDASGGAGESSGGGGDRASLGKGTVVGAGRSSVNENI